jgi:hypothetical protein
MCDVWRMTDHILFILFPGLSSEYKAKRRRADLFLFRIKSEVIFSYEVKRKDKDKIVPVLN